jgi:uncharacterized protein YbjQ (UPF0145 family)
MGVWTQTVILAVVGGLGLGLGVVFFQRTMDSRKRYVGQDCAMGIKTLSGGELTSYMQLGDEARQRSVDRMLAMAKRHAANAIINVEFELTSMGNTMTVVHGTAVVIEPLPDFIPTGAVGNILFDIPESLRDSRPVRPGGL